MRNRPVVIPVLFFLLCLLFTPGCAKKDNSQPSIPSAPGIVTLPASNVTDSTAISGVELISGIYTVTEKGICYSKTMQPTITDMVIKGGSDTGTYSAQLKGLVSHTTYFVRGYVKTAGTVFYGNQISFTTSVYVDPPIALFVGKGRMVGTIRNF